MTVSDDIFEIAKLCADASDVAGEKLGALGPRPDGGPEAALWDSEESRLYAQRFRLSRYASYFAALSVHQALTDNWPTLGDLADVAERATDRIKAAEELGKALAKLADVMDFAVSVALFAGSPSAATAQGIYKAFGELKADA